MNAKEAIDYTIKQSEFMSPMAAAFFKLNVLSLILDKHWANSTEDKG